MNVLVKYRICITPKNSVFPTIENLILGHSSSAGKRITSYILSDVWVSHYTSCFLFDVWRTPYVYLSICILIRLGYIRGHVGNLRLS